MNNTFQTHLKAKSILILGCLTTFHGFSCLLAQTESTIVINSQPGIIQSGVVPSMQMNPSVETVEEEVAGSLLKRLSGETKVASNVMEGGEAASVDQVESLGGFSVDSSSHEETEESVIIPPDELAAAIQVVLETHVAQSVKEKVLDKVAERLKITSIKRSELEEVKNEMEKDAAYFNNDARAKSTGIWTNPLGAPAHQEAKNAAIFAKNTSDEAVLAKKEYDSQNIQEFMFQASLEAASLRIANSKMDAAMIERQEATIAKAFSEANSARANLLYTWLNNRIPGGAAIAYGKASYAEGVAQNKYAQLVMNDALTDATQKTLGAYDAWKNRIATDILVDMETENLESHAKKYGSRTTQTKTHWEHCRAQAILKADQAALRAAWSWVSHEESTVTSSSSNSQLKEVESNSSSQEITEKSNISSEELLAAATQVFLDAKTSQTLKEKILAEVMDQLQEVSVKRNELEKTKEELEKNAAYLNNDAKEKSSAAWASPLNSQGHQEAKKARDFAKSIRMEAIVANQEYDAQKIQEFMLQKALEATRIRIVNTKMDAMMIKRQESAIVEAFHEVNLILVKSKYDWDSSHIAMATMGRATAGIKEAAAQKAYAQHVINEVMSDAKQNKSELYDSWQNRIITDSLVVLETEALVTSSQGDSAAKLEAQWRCSRAKAILEADKAALRAAWPLGTIVMIRESERASLFGI